jgi:hypothetical protein
MLYPERQSPFLGGPGGSDEPSRMGLHLNALRVSRGQAPYGTL